MKSTRFLFGSQRALEHACMHILDFLRGMTARIDGRKGIGFGLVYVVHPILNHMLVTTKVLGYRRTLEFSKK